MVIVQGKVCRVYSFGPGNESFRNEWSRERIVLRTNVPDTVTMDGRMHRVGLSASAELLVKN